MQQTENEKLPGSKGILAWVKEILRKSDPPVTELPLAPDPAMVGRLIERAAGDGDADDAGRDPSGGDGGSAGKEGCAYAMRRNIVASLQEIRRFAEENQLASTVVRALLSLLAEMALEALKGKVSGNVLTALLKVFNYDRDRQEAYRRGKRDGRNDKIIDEYYPMDDDGLPHLGSTSGPAADADNIFSIAKEA